MARYGAPNQADGIYDRHSHEQTKQYYNNSATSVPTRIAENSFYSNSTLSGMVIAERVKIIIYVIVWSVVFLNRSGDLNTVAVVAQIGFSEQLLSRWFRIEWLRLKCETLFEELFQLLKTRTKVEVLAVRIMDEYEIAKATAGVTLSTKVFMRKQEHTDREWESIRRTLGV
jgi:hypothetical protein